MDKLMIFDAHCDTANVLLDQPYFLDETKSHLKIEKIKAGGLTAQIFAIWVNPVYIPNSCIKKALLLYQALENKLFSTNHAIKVSTSLQMDNAINNNKIAGWLSLEGGHIIENSIDILEFFYTLGFRSMTLTHTKTTDWADSSGDKSRWDGLNKKGVKIIEKMDQMGMVIDVSHSSDKTVEDVLEYSKKPIMASHSNARSLCKVPRNLSDDLIKEISSRNGFIGINFYPGFLDKKIYNQVLKNLKKHKKQHEKRIKNFENDPDKINESEIELYKKMVEGIDGVSLNKVVDHIAYISDVGGIDCVGLGSDFDGIPTTPSDLYDVSCYPALIEGLKNKGFNELEISKIIGLNLYTFMKNFD